MRISIAFIVVLLSAAGAFGQQVPSVRVAPVERRSIEITRPLVATVEPVTISTLAAETEGLVEQRMFDEGQVVPAGEALVRQDIQLLQAEQRAAEAAVKSAQARLTEAQAEHRNARQEAERLTRMYEANTATEKEFRDAVTRAETAAATVTAREAELAAREAELQRLKTQIEKSTIRAPFEGVIARRYVERGQWLRTGDPVAQIVQLDPLFVRVGVPEAVIPRIKEGDEARVLIDALGTEVVGKIEQILPQADPATRTFPVKLLVSNPELKIRPGFFARVILVWGEDEQMVVVPRDAVMTQNRQSHVVAVRNGAAAIVPVTLGPADGSNIAVRGELQPGELVVIRGNETLQPGQPLNVINLPAGNGGAAPSGHPQQPQQPDQQQQ